MILILFHILNMIANTGSFPFYDSVKAFFKLIYLVSCLVQLISKFSGLIEGTTCPATTNILESEITTIQGRGPFLDIYHTWSGNHQYFVPAPDF